MLAGLDTPVAALALLVADHDESRGFFLGECFFGAGFDAFGIFAGSACQREVEQGLHADDADSASQRAVFAFFGDAGEFADAAAGAFARIDGDELSFSELGWHSLNLVRLRYLNIALEPMDFPREILSGRL